MTNRGIAAVPCVLAALATTACSLDINSGDAVVREEQTFTISGAPVLEVDTFDGSVQVSAWDRPEIRVRIEKHGRDREAAAALQVKVAQDGGRLRVQAPAPDKDTGGITIGASRSVSFTFMVPRKAHVLVRSGDGSISVEDVAGRVELHSGDGSIRATRLAGEVVAESGDGSVSLDGQFARVRATSEDGSVAVDAAGGSAAEQDWELYTGDGSITMKLPDSFDAKVEADTGDGSISISGIRDRDGDSDSHSVRGVLGRGGHTLKVRSGDGSIRIATR
jgi:hypothetical protein